MELRAQANADALRRASQTLQDSGRPVELVPGPNEHEVDVIDAPIAETAARGRVNADGVFVPEPEPGQPYHANAEGKYDPAGTSGATREFPDIEPDPVIEEWQQWIESGGKESAPVVERAAPDDHRAGGGDERQQDEPSRGDDRRGAVEPSGEASKGETEKTLVKSERTEYSSVELVLDRPDVRIKAYAEREGIQPLVPIRGKRGELLALVRPETARAWAGYLPAWLDHPVNGGKQIRVAEPAGDLQADDFRAMASGVHLTLMGGAFILIAAAGFVAAITGLVIHFTSKQMQE
ncbi:MAG TPA: hypothetical protein VK807_23360 [Gemmatimonadaceae bacterium]|nr:hypothetical protein [Gemmatimonadaceae bacterium]